MKTKLIDLLGLTNMANDIRDWVNAKFQRKVDGKGLSTNDYDATAKAKVDAIPDNPQYTDTQYTAGDGISIDDNVISATGGGGGGEENVIEAITMNSASVPITNKTAAITETDPTVPSWAKQQTKPSYNYSEIGNTPDLSGFITKSVNDLTNYYLKSETYTKDEVAALIGAIQQFHYEIYATLPASGESNVLYLIGPTGSGSDRYEEYVYANNAFTKIGDTSIDLSGYVTTSALNTALNDYVLSSSITDVLRYSSQSLTNAQKSQARTNIGATAPEVFMATYGTTTVSEIESAITAGKVVVCYYNDRLYYLSYYYSSDLYIYFVAALQDEITYLRLKRSNDSWSTQNYRCEQTANKVTSFQTTPDDTHYPSEKLVKDSLDTKIDNTDVEALTAIDVDNTPTASSTNLVTSGGVYNVLLNKQDKMPISSASGTTLSAVANTYHNFTSEVNTLAITLPAVTDVTHITNIVFMLTTGTTPAITFAASGTGVNVIAQDGFSIEASTTYEINAIFNGTMWVVAAMKLNTTDIQPSNP